MWAVKSGTPTKEKGLLGFGRDNFQLIAAWVVPGEWRPLVQIYDVYKADISWIVLSTWIFIRYSF